MRDWAFGWPEVQRMTGDCLPDNTASARILEKLGMRNRVELTRYAIRAGLIEP